MRSRSSSSRMLDLSPLDDELQPDRTGTAERGVQTVVEAIGDGRNPRTTGGTGPDRTTGGAIVPGLTTGGMSVRGLMSGDTTVQGLTSGDTTARGRETGEVNDLSPMRGGTTIETNGQLDQILEGCPREHRPVATQNKTLGTRPEVPPIEQWRPRQRTATMAPSATPADRSRRLFAAGR